MHVIYWYLHHWCRNIDDQNDREQFPRNIPQDFSSISTDWMRCSGSVAWRTGTGRWMWPIRASVTSDDLSHSVYPSLYLSENRNINTLKKWLGRVDKWGRYFLFRVLHFENTQHCICTVIILSCFLGISIDEDQLHWLVVILKKCFLTWWPWHLTYNLDLHTWPTYPSTWPMPKFRSVFLSVWPWEW